MAGKKELADQMKDLEGSIAAYVNLIKVTRSDQQNPGFVQRQITSHEERIVWHQQQIVALKLRSTDGDRIIKDAKREITKLRKQLLIIRHARDIERLKKLALQLQEAESE